MVMSIEPKNRGDNGLIEQGVDLAAVNGHRLEAKPAAVTTALYQHRKLPGRPFQKGVSGNPAGRPRGSRHRLEESFVAALADDFHEHGVEAIRRCRIER